MTAAATAPTEPVERLPWTSGIAPAYIGTFLWIAFLDRLGQRALPVGGLAPAVLGVVAGSVLAYLLLYRLPAAWGFASGRPLDGVATSTFGTAGARLVPALPLVVAQVVLFAVGIGYGVDGVLRGLVTMGLLDPSAVRPVAWRGGAVPAPVFLVSALVWGLAVGLVGMGIVRWIAAIMRYFPVFPAAGLALAMAAHLSGLGDFRPDGVDPSTGRVPPGSSGVGVAFLATFGWTFGFAALLGLNGADWGAGSPSAADARKGGWFGMALAPAIVGTLALLAVAGHEGKLQARASSLIPGDPTQSPLAGPGRAAPRAETTIADVAPAPALATHAPDRRGTLRSAAEGALDGRVGGTILIIFGLASLAPACFAAHDFGRRAAAAVPRVSRLAWTLLGVAAGWFLILGDWHERTGTIFAALGALFAPVAGAMMADAARQPAEAWPGPRPVVNAAGLVAWLAGVVVGLAPVVGPAAGWPGLDRITPAPLLAFVVAYVVYRLAAGVGLEPKAS